MCKNSFAQTPAYKHYDVSNGLPTNEVYEIKQDSKGFLWIGCDAGLVRYDGNRFKLYTNARSRGPAINGLSEDKYGHIWCSNFSGQVFYAGGDSLYLFHPWEKRYLNSYADVTCDGKSNIYISNFQNKLYKYNIDTKEETVVLNDYTAKKKVFTVYNGNILYTLLDSGIVKQISGSSIQTVAKLGTNGAPIAKQFYENLVFYNSYKKKQTLCFQRFNQETPEPVLYYYKDNALHTHAATAVLKEQKIYPLSCFDDDNGNLLIGTHNELLWLKRNANGQYNLYNRMLAGNAISFIMKDAEGTIWVSTLKNGMFKIANADIWWVQPEIFNFKSPGINHLASDGKNVLYGTAVSGEVFGYDVVAKSVFKIPTKESRDAQALEFNKYSNELFISKINTIIYDPAANRTTELERSITNTKDFFFTAEGSIFTTGGSLYQATRNKDPLFESRFFSLFDTVRPSYIYRFINDPGWKNFILSEQRNKGVWFDETSNTLWSGFVDGTVYFENKKLMKLIDDKTGQPVITTSFAQAINGNLILGTVEQGVFIVRNKKIVKRYSVADGLLSDKIKRLHYNNGILWIINGGAVQCLEMISGKIKTINIHDGLLSPEIYDVEVMNHTVYVATSAGIQFFPENVETGNRQPPVTGIISLMADERKYFPGTDIKLSPGIKNILIELLGISLKSDGTFKYQYRLLPADTNWITVGAAENNIRFSSLSPGAYTFQSRVINEDGVMSKETSVLKFTIAKPWWQRWWFLLACAAVMAILVFVIFNARMKAGRKKAGEEIARAKVQEELRRSQLSSLKAQMNPHFMFNALNSIQEFILLNDKKQANMYMGKFADMMRMILDMSNKEKITLDEEQKALELYLQLEALRFEEQFNYSVERDESIIDGYINMPPMIIQPYVENAIKHGLLHKQGEKKLSICFSLVNEHTLCCVVSDNGIGRKVSNEINEMRQKKHASFATSATQKRLDLLNYQKKELIAVAYQDLHDAAGRASGTVVTINIPV